jgi:hypothetical protein
MVELACTNCRSRLLLPLGHSGPTYRCPFCGNLVPVPESSPSPVRDPGPPAAAEPPRQFPPSPAPARAPTRLVVYFGLGAVGVCVLLGLLVMILGHVKRSAERAIAMNNMKQIALACHAHGDIYQFLPTPKMVSKEGGSVDLSWRVTVLGYVEQQSLYTLFDQTSGWDSPRNKSLLDMMPAVYVDPIRQHETEPADSRSTQFRTTHFQLFTGPGTAFPNNDRQVRRGELPDNTFLFGEAGQDVPWTKPADMVILPDQALPLATGTVLIGLFDGSVRVVERDHITDETLRWYLRPGGGTPPPLD